MELIQFRPMSRLHVKATKVSSARFPVIDFHSHLSWGTHDGTIPRWDCRELAERVTNLLSDMKRKNVSQIVNLTGGAGSCLDATIRMFATGNRNKFLVFTEPWWSRANQPGYSQFQADELSRARRAGASGLKVLKTMGLLLREEISRGPLIKVDDPRFDPMWEACGALNMPVAIHTSDPEAFFLPVDGYNERFEELCQHPDWSFYGKDFPTKRELLEARNRVFERHPRTQFVAVHVGNNAENLAYVSECLDRFPNMYIDIAARIAELGRQPRTAYKFFDRYQDRILFGTDLMPGGPSPDELYDTYFRFLESEDEYFPYAPESIPPQGRWRIYGLGLPDQILRKVYHDNPARVLDIGNSTALERVTKDK